MFSVEETFIFLRTRYPAEENTEKVTCRGCGKRQDRREGERILGRERRGREVRMGERKKGRVIIIIIINPLTARVVGAPQMILQPVFYIFPCSPLPSGTCRTPDLMLSSHLFLCLPCLLPSFTVPRKMLLARPN